MLPKIDYMTMSCTVNDPRTITVKIFGNWEVLAFVWVLGSG